MEDNIAELKKISRKREQFIADREANLGRRLTTLERKLLSLVLEKFVSEFVNSNGILTLKGKLVNVTTVLDQIFEQFIKDQNLSIIREMVTDFGTISSLNFDYFSKIAGNKQVNEIKKLADTELMDRIGLNANKRLIKGGFLDSFVSDSGVKNKLKKYTYRSVSGGIPYRNFIKGLERLIISAPERDSALRNHYKTFAFDIYAQFDASIGNQWRTRLGLRCAIYAGNRIETTRDFCIKHLNKVYTIDEMKEWKDDPTLPRTKDEKKTGIVTNYIPWIDRGRWNCRHQMNWISDQMAIRMRPSLKRVLQKA